ncbi:hypothetical protein L6452_32157 [Arctium lappa]|uniref:Uncharacterized protein n=1 Tax=Arctium lappa TaxID=4217 RepID=A0ACB8Z4Q4_ARCLA|nr:hypothetical protein L6452_32157 [Arctium lappa]
MNPSELVSDQRAPQSAAPAVSPVKYSVDGISKVTVNNEVKVKTLQAVSSVKSSDDDIGKVDHQDKPSSVPITQLIDRPPSILTNSQSFNLVPYWFFLLPFCHSPFSLSDATETTLLDNDRIPWKLPFTSRQ